MHAKVWDLKATSGLGIDIIKYIFLYDMSVILKDTLVREFLFSESDVCSPPSRCVCVDCLGRSLWMGQMEFCPFITKIGHGKYGTLVEGVMLESAEGYQKVERKWYKAGLEHVF